MKVLLDTSVLINANATANVPADALAAISVASLSELHFGVLVAKDADERARRLRRLAAIENGFDALPVRASTARIHGQMLAAVHAAGRQPRRRSMDLLIAATAADNGAALLTLNIDDFTGLDTFLQVLHPDTLNR